MTADVRTLPHPARYVPIVGRMLIAALEQLQRGSLRLVLPNGETHCFSGADGGPHAEWVIRDWRALTAGFRRGDVGLAEAFRDGWWESPNLTALIEFAVANEALLATPLNGRWWARALFRLRHWLRPNSRRGSRRNIHAHYDIGNAFYRLWLDSSMTYSAALFASDRCSLEQAQIAKFERILDLLAVKPGDHILEIGCGWGGFAAYAARTRSCRVTGITISQAQAEEGRRRIESAGLEQRVDLRLCDYRDIDGQYDHVVSIEMLEAVGESYWPRYFDVVRSRLKPGGSAVIQTITIHDDQFERYRRGSDFIREYIFPGGMLPCEGRLRELASTTRLRWHGLHSFGMHYATTLERWRHAFDRCRHALPTQGLDERFIRLWQFYLAYCEAGFRCGRTNVVHLVLGRE